MKTPISIITETARLHNDLPVVYFTKPYLANQNHEQLVCYDSEQCFFPVSIHENLAISIPRSPFGSVFVKDRWNYDEFLHALDEVKLDLKGRGVDMLQIKHPSSIYDSLVDEQWLEDAEFDRLFVDITQQIPLSDGWKNDIHQMQKRKLNSLVEEQFEFKKMEAEELETAHKFIAVCRQTQGLIVNIDFELLKKLAEETNAYDIFGVFRDGKISSVCIALRVTDKVAYYYLPATSPMFRTQSPMVLLIKGMVEYYHSQGFKYLDMGISSVEGKPQESLRIFKERMGSEESSKTTWQLPL